MICTAIYERTLIKLLKPVPNSHLDTLVYSVLLCHGVDYRLNTGLAKHILLKKIFDTFLVFYNAEMKKNQHLGSFKYGNDLRKIKKHI